MNILTAENISKTYGDKQILNNVTFGIDDGDKIGIIGINGTGKSSLLKMIAGLEEPDEGSIVKGNHVYIEFLQQTPEFNNKDEKILDYVLAGKSEDEYWQYRGEAVTILTKLGMDQFEQPVRHLSGGQKKKVALARTLLTPAEILILDEPTNHLDNAMSEWLEDYLKNMKKSLIMVTHDRYFLDSITNKIMEIDQAGLYTYEGNYSEFLRRKSERLESQAATEQKRKVLLRNELKWVMRGARARSTKQKARLERFEELKAQRNQQIQEELQMTSVGSRLGKKTIIVDSVSKTYDEHTLFDNFTYTFLRNDRIGIIGPNGAGKTTLLKIICGQEQPDKGQVETGETVRIGYFAQDSLLPNDSQRVIDYIKETAEYIQTPDGQVSASLMLERFLFTRDMQWTPVGKLSGGEKRRLYLLKVLMEEPNVLILDEPTNDLDIQTLNILEDYLDGFAGIIIAVSHDRYFLDRVVRRIFAIEGQSVNQYEGGYSDYLLASQAEDAQETVQQPKTERLKAADYRKKEKKLKFTFKEQKEYETIDSDIETIENQIADTEKQIGEAARDFVKLNQLMQTKEELENLLNEKTERWIYLNELAERIQEENLLDKSNG